MRKHLIILSGLLFIFAGSAIAETSANYVGKYGVSVTGKRHRKNLRHLLLAGNLKGDKKVVYKKFGYTPHRLRQTMAGETTERWLYLERGIEFVFDDDGNVIDKRRILKEDRRGWD
jgi:hypothetical protein